MPDSTVAGKKITVFYYKKSDHFDLQSASNAWEAQAPEIPEQFHSALVDKAISIGYKDPRNINIELATFFEQEYQQVEKKAKKYARMHHQTAGYIRPVDF